MFMLRFLAGAASSLAGRIRRDRPASDEGQNLQLWAKPGAAR